VLFACESAEISQEDQDGRPAAQILHAATLTAEVSEAERGCWKPGTDGHFYLQRSDRLSEEPEIRPYGVGRIPGLRGDAIRLARGFDPGSAERPEGEKRSQDHAVHQVGKDP
jgi:hypothetical protein